MDKLCITSLSRNQQDELSFFNLLVLAIYFSTSTHILYFLLQKTVGKNGLHLEIIDHGIITYFEKIINNHLGFHIWIYVTQSFLDA